MKVIVGGTFDYLHIGHRALLKCAFETAGPDGSVTIGLTTDTFAAAKYHPVRPYETRLAELKNWIQKEKYQTSYEIIPICDAFGTTLTTDFDALVVSFETYPVGELINEKRIAAGKKPVILKNVNCVNADDEKPVSTTRICRGEITPEGKVTQNNKPPSTREKSPRDN